jgi:hypothetical protein
VELRSRREPEALRALESETLGLIDTIQADKTWEMVEGPHCRRCSYQTICPAWSPQLRLPGI